MGAQAGSVRGRCACAVAVTPPGSEYVVQAAARGEGQRAAAAFSKQQVQACARVKAQGAAKARYDASVKEKNAVRAAWCVLYAHGVPRCDTRRAEMRAAARVRQG